jgi:hypothetical protein
VSNEQTDQVLFEILHGHEPIARNRYEMDEALTCSHQDWEGEIFAGHLVLLIDEGLARRGLKISTMD